MNDNRPPDSRERLISRALTTTAIVSEHLTVGMEHLLSKSGATPGFQLVIKEFIGPVVLQLSHLEKDILRVRDELIPKQVVNGIVSQLELFAEEFSRGAKTPDQTRTAGVFSEFVREVANLGPERQLVKKEPRREPKREKDGPDLEM